MQLAWLTETHLDSGPTTDWQVLKSAYLHRSCLKYRQRKFKMNCVEIFRCCRSPDIVSMTLFSMTWLFVKRRHTYRHSVHFLKQISNSLTSGFLLKCKNGFHFTTNQSKSHKKDKKHCVGYFFLRRYLLMHK